MQEKVRENLGFDDEGVESIRYVLQGSDTEPNVSL